MTIIEFFNNFFTRTHPIPIPEKYISRKDKIVADWTFDNQFHMEFGTWEWEVGKYTKNRTVFKQAEERCGGATHITVITRNGRRIYDRWWKRPMRYINKTY